MPDIKHKYHYIDTDLDRDVLAANIRHNAQKFIQSKKNWRQPQIDAFMDSLNNYLAALEEGRLSTEVAGAVHDSAGLLQNDPENFFDKRRGHITGEEADRFSERRKRKLKPGFYANREAATFIDQIAGALYRKGLEDAEEEEEKPEATKFGWASGLWKSFMNYLNPNGTPNIEAWLDKDTYDEKTGKRGYANRAKYFSDYINTYINSLPEEMDFSDVGTGWTKDDYILALRNLQGQLAKEDAVNNDFYLMLDQLGSDSNEYMPYWTSDRKYGEVVDPDEADRKRLNDDIKNVMTQQRQIYNPQFFYGAGAPGAAAPGFQLDTKATTPDEVRDSFYRAVNDYNKKSTNPQLDFSAFGLSQATGREWAPYIEQLYKVNDDMFNVVGGNSAYNGWRYIPASYNSQSGTVLGFDPTTKATGRLFLGDLDNNALQMYRGNIGNELLNSVDEYGNPLYSKRGGVLYAKKGTKASTSADDLENDEEYQQELAQYEALLAQSGYGTDDSAAEGQYYAQQSAANPYAGYDDEDAQTAQGLYSGYGRYGPYGGYGGYAGYNQGGQYNTNDKYADILSGYNQYQQSVMQTEAYNNQRMTQSDQTRNDHGLSRPWAGEESQYNTNLLATTDKVRLASMAADIAAIIDPDGMSSLGLSLGSDVANLWADLKDNNVSTGKAWGSFAANLGLSSLAIIPVVGGALGKGAGLASKMAKFAPKLGHVLLASGAVMALSNGEDIMKSVNKLISKKDGSIEGKMTLDDWRNIYTGLSAVLGTTNAIKSAKVAKTLKSKSKTGRQLVLARNQNGETKYLAFSGEEAAKIKKAASEKNAKPIEELVGKYRVKGDNGRYTNEKFTLVQDETAAREGWHGFGKREASSKFNPNSVIEETSAEALRNNAESIRQAGGFGSRRAYNMAMNAEKYYYGLPYNPEIAEGNTGRRTRGTSGTRGNRGRGGNGGSGAQDIIPAEVVNEAGNVSGAAGAQNNLPVVQQTAGAVSGAAGTQNNLSVVQQTAGAVSGANPQYNMLPEYRGNAMKESFLGGMPAQEVKGFNTRSSKYNKSLRQGLDARLKESTPDFFTNSNTKNALKYGRGKLTGAVATAQKEKIGDIKNDLQAYSNYVSKHGHTKNVEALMNRFNLTNQDAWLLGILREGGQVNPETIRSARQALAVFQQGGIIKKKFR